MSTSQGSLPPLGMIIDERLLTSWLNTSVETIAAHRQQLVPLLGLLGEVFGGVQEAAHRNEALRVLLDNLQRSEGALLCADARLNDLDMALMEGQPADVHIIHEAMTSLDRAKWYLHNASDLARKIGRELPTT